MQGRLIFFLICLFFIFLFNAADFAELYEGVDSFFPCVVGRRKRINAIFPTSLMVIPLLVFELHGKMEVLYIILYDVVYTLIYVLLYFLIKKKKDERKDNKK